MISGWKRRQVSIGNYGRADLICYDRKYAPWSQNQDPFPSITIFELKKNKIDNSSFIQALRYLKGVQRFMEKRGLEIVEYKIVIIGRDVDVHSDLIYLPNIICSDNEFGLTSISVFTYEYLYDGIRFENQNGFKLIDEGF